MHLQQIRTFVTVANLGHLTKAAKVLHLTQPAVSGQLKSLEDALHMKLLSRTATGMALTPSGRKLLPKAENILLALDEFRNSAKALQGTLSGQLRIGLIMIDPDFLKLGELITKMVERHVDVTIDLEVGGVQRCVTGVESGALDGAFYAGAAPHRIINAMQLDLLKYRVIAPTQWANKLRSAIWGNLALMPWIRAPQPSAHHNMMSEMFRHASLEPVKIIEVDHESVIVSLVKAGVGLSVIREDLALATAAKGDVIIWEQAAPMHIPLSFIHHVDRQYDPLLLAFIEALKELWDIPHNDDTDNALFSDITQ